ncbi:MAG: phospholipase [Pseudonocardiaceae bacterium]
MTGVGVPMAIRWGSSDPAAPLIVLLQGFSAPGEATEKDLAAFAPCLPVGAGYASVRVPRPPSEQGFASFREWLDDQAAPQVPVVLVGFGSGAAFAGGLLLAEPARFAAAGLLCGTLPFDAGVPVTRGRLVGVPVFLTHGVRDTVIPVELQRRTWNYLVRESGSPLWAQRAPTGHELTAKMVSELGGWIEARLGYLQQHAVPAGGRAADQTCWPTLPDGLLPLRAGDSPEVSVTTPQQQESQNAPLELQEALFSRISTLDGVVTGPSAVSVPGARAFLLPPSRLPSSRLTPGHGSEAEQPSEAFIVSELGEFAHLHPGYDGSMHLVLPIPLAHDVVIKGWGVAHPLAGIRLTPGMVMIFGPRNPAELNIVTAIARASHSHAARSTTRGHGAPFRGSYDATL